MQGILGWGAYLPYRRLDRSSIPAVAGGGGGKGTRTVASYDEDATTLGVEAARVALHSSPGVEPASLWFSTVEPPYLDKTNATAVHAALRLRRAAPAYDVVGSTRSTVGALRAGLASRGPALVVASGLRTGLPGGPDEAAGGDGGAALLVGGEGDGPVLAEVLAWGAATEEFVDRWRLPGDIRSKQWEERFGETRYPPLAVDAWEQALKGAGLTADQVDHLIVTGANARAATASVRKLGVPADRVAGNLDGAVGNTGAAHPLLLLATVLEATSPGKVVALVVLADGADVALLRTTDALAAYRPARPVAAQLDNGGPIPYGKYLSWRGLLQVEPPRRPEPARPSASAAGRSVEWKFGFVGSQADDGTVHLPPSPLDHGQRPMADAKGTIVTYTVDQLALPPHPPGG